MRIRIQHITLMRIRIQLITLTRIRMQIRILPFNLMRIRIHNTYRIFDKLRFIFNYSICVCVTMKEGNKIKMVFLVRKNITFCNMKIRNRIFISVMQISKLPDL
jgi:hypothetical protein